MNKETKFNLKVQSYQSCFIYVFNISNRKLVVYVLSIIRPPLRFFFSCSIGINIKATESVDVSLCICVCMCGREEKKWKKEEQNSWQWRAQLDHCSLVCSRPSSRPYFDTIVPSTSLSARIRRGTIHGGQRKDVSVLRPWPRQDIDW